MSKIHFSGTRVSCYLAHLRRKLIGELIVYRQVSVRPSTFSNNISEAMKPILTKFYIQHLHGHSDRREKCVGGYETGDWKGHRDVKLEPPVSHGYDSL